MPRQPILTAALALAVLAMITLGLTGCADTPQPAASRPLTEACWGGTGQCSPQRHRALVACWGDDEQHDPWQRAYGDQNACQWIRDDDQRQQQAIEQAKRDDLMAIMALGPFQPTAYSLTVNRGFSW